MRPNDDNGSSKQWRLTGRDGSPGVQLVPDVVEVDPVVVVVAVDLHLPRKAARQSSVAIHLPLLVNHVLRVFSTSLPSLLSTRSFDQVLREFTRYFICQPGL